MLFSPEKQKQIDQLKCMLEKAQEIERAEKDLRELEERTQHSLEIAKNDYGKELEDLDKKFSHEIAAASSRFNSHSGIRIVFTILALIASIVLTVMLEAQICTEPLHGVERVFLYSFVVVVNAAIGFVSLALSVANDDN